MSIQSLKNAMKKFQCYDDYESTGGITEEVVFEAEKKLGIKFSEEQRLYYKTCGYCSFEGTEIFGIFLNTNTGILWGNSLARALHYRKAYALPETWIPICELDDGIMAFLNYAKLNTSNEPEVIAAYYNGDEYIIGEKIADDLGDFLLELTISMDN